MQIVDADALKDQLLYDNVHGRICNTTYEHCLKAIQNASDVTSNVEPQMVKHLIVEALQKATATETRPDIVAGLLEAQRIVINMKVGETNETNKT